MSDKITTPVLPALSQLNSQTRLRKLRKPTVTPRGPRLYRLDSYPRIVGAGPGDPPEGFVGPHTSNDEWVYYWALATVMGDPPNPRMPPFAGGLNWSYQHPDPILGGRETTGGAVVDFLIRESPVNGQAMVHRLQTEFHHIMAAADIIARDLYQKTHLSGYSKIVDVYSQWFIGDPTGAAACATARRALAGDEQPSPLSFGLAQRVRA